MAAAVKRLKWEADYAVVEEHQRCNRAVKANGKGVVERLANDVLTAQENVDVRNGQEALVLLVEDDVAPATEAGAGAISTDVGSTQATSDVGSQRSSVGEAICHEDEVEGLEAGPSVSI